MTPPLAASIIDVVLGLALAPTDQESSNRFSLEGLSFGARNDGALEIAGALMLQLFVQDAQLRLALNLANIKMSGLRLHRDHRESA